MSEVKAWRSGDGQLWDTLEEAEDVDRMLTLKAKLKDIVDHFYHTGITKGEIEDGLRLYRHELAMIFWEYDRRA